MDQQEAEVMPGQHNTTQATASEQGEPVYWEWRHLSTHPDTVDFGQWSEWKRVEGSSPIHTAEDALNDFRAYIASGYKYELRALYTAQPAPAASPMDELHPLTFFARECELGVFMEHEVSMAARKAINAAKQYRIGSQPTAPAAVPAVPEGMKLVPVEPTPEMVGAFADATDDEPIWHQTTEEDRQETIKLFGPCYRAMLASAPTSTEGGA
jgi:hypothetical protein